MAGRRCHGGVKCRRLRTVGRVTIMPTQSGVPSIAHREGARIGVILLHREIENIISSAAKIRHGIKLKKSKNESDDVMAANRMAYRAWAVTAPYAPEACGQATLCMSSARAAR